MLFAPEYREVYQDGRMHWESVGTWEIWNPLTGERLELPDPDIRLHVVGAGIGYECVADDYRVVVIDYDGESTRRTHVYSLKSDSWRKIGDCPFGIWSWDVQHGVFLDGALHWVSRDDEIIVAFDFANENYRHLALPEFQTPPDSMQLEALGGCLLLSYVVEEDRRNSFHRHFQQFHVWVMSDYGADDSWIMFFSSKEKLDFRIFGNRIRCVAYMKNQKRVLMQHRNGFFWFDVESNSMKTVDIHGFGRDSNISARICLRSLLRLHDSCGRGASNIRTRKRGAMDKVDTKLTFCIRDHEIFDPRDYGKRNPTDPTSHDDCYKIDSNWYTCSCQGDKIRTVSSNPDSGSLVPLDICREIFLRLPAKSLIRFRAVCKAYQAFIDEPLFVKAHTNNQLSPNNILIRNSSGPPFFPFYSFNLDALNCTDGLQPIPTTPLGFTHSGLPRLPAAVCNGLILVADEKWRMLNPLTDECLQLPEGEFNSDVRATGLGYDCTTDDYKVIVVDCCLERETYVYRTHVYSLRSDSWRMIGNFPRDNAWWGPNRPGVYLCGALHWEASRWTNKVIVLDLGTENYRQMQWPPVRIRHSIVVSKRSLDVLGGCLVVTDYVKAYDNEKDGIDVWMMKDYGADDSWIKLFSIMEEFDVHKFYENLRPVAYMKNTSQICMQDARGLFLFDVDSNSMKKVYIHGLSKSSSAQNFSESIFRLHDNCGVSGSVSLTRQRTKIKKRALVEISDTDCRLYFCVKDVRQLHKMISNSKHNQNQREFDFFRNPILVLNL